jgi:hypothetical protein
LVRVDEMERAENPEVPRLLNWLMYEELARKEAILKQFLDHAQ